MQYLSSNLSLPRWLLPSRYARSQWAGYAVAVILVAAALWSRLLLAPALGGRVPFASFFVAVALTAWFGGYGPCLLSVFLGTLASWYFILEPQYSFAAKEPFQVFGIVAFVFTGLAIATFSGQMRRALRALYEARQDSDRRVREAEQARRELDRVVQEQTRLVHALQESDRRFRGFADNTENVLWIVRADRDELVYVSRAFRRVYGREPDELYQDFNALHRYMHESDRERSRQFWTRAGSALTVEDYRIVRPDGSIAWVRRHGFPIPDAQGALEYRAAISEDITEEKHIQDERDRLLQSERAARLEAERSNRIKDEFLATLSHELRSPLNAILGWVQILKLKPPAPEVLGQALDALERNSQAQARLIEDLLDMSRIVSGKFRLDVQTVELAPLIRTTVESLLPAAQAKHIAVQQVLDPLAGPVKGDPNRLQQIVWNLLSNAVKFTPKAGKVQVHLERVNSHCEISVSDTGIGITPEFLPHVFERFRQQDATTTRHEGGLGLGLAIVKQLVEHHGGSVSASSPGPGQGATFTVCLPIAIAAARFESTQAGDQSGEVIAATGLSLDDTRILVVDDDSDACEVLRTILEERHASVDTALSAARALEKIRAQPPDVLISDVGMPGQDGYQFIAELRRMGEPFRSIPAVAVTAFARAEDRVRALQAGYNMHVAKPINALELLTVIARLRAHS